MLEVIKPYTLSLNPNMHLVIVESPTKAKTIQKFLGRGYNVQSSYGHIRDLPKAEMGIDIENNFRPRYVIPRDKRKYLSHLKKEMRKAKEIILATDEDREGEAIAWHLVTALALEGKPIQRIVFHEITSEAIEEALKNPRRINMNLVDAQQARRILDRLVGYELSPFLWKKVVKGLSAGRVQSVAVRLIVEREREIQNFVSQEYWTIEGKFNKKEAGQETFIAKLYKIDDKVLKKLAIKSKEEAEKILKDLEGTTYQVIDLQKKETQKMPGPPFTTSTLQQVANSRLGFSARQTMRIAQQLYEGIELGPEGSTGLITYMRTDSVTLAQKFLEESQKYIRENIGQDYSLTKPRYFKTKSRLAQEAHEAIRPTKASRAPEAIKPLLQPKQFKIYDLIWRRTIASQMAEAQVQNTIADIGAQEKYIFRATGLNLKFDGFLKIWPETTKENILPPLRIQEIIDLVKITSYQHFTQPPARYSDAGLVKALEEYGIGRPSTYAPIISTIQDRGYVEREDRRLKPKEIAFLVNDLLVTHFPRIVDYKFTAHMEDDLDKIAENKQSWQTTIKELYEPFKKNLTKKYQEINKKDLTEEETKEICEKCGALMIIKIGRYGKFLACSKFPECKNTKPLAGNQEGGMRNEEIKSSDEKCEKCGQPMQIRRGRYGDFQGCSGYPECKNIKPLNKTTGVKCPACGQGEIVERKSKKGRTFYGCDQYPNCHFALWQKPVDEKCPKCGAIMVMGKNQTRVCSDKECQN